MQFIKRFFLIGNDLRITYGYVGNPEFVGKAIFKNSTCHPKYDERKFILHHGRREVPSFLICSQIYDLKVWRQDTSKRCGYFLGILLVMYHNYLCMHIRG